MRSPGRALAIVAPGLVVGACLAGEQGVLPPLHRTTPDAGAPPALFADAFGGAVADSKLPPLPPHSVAGIDPTHGPFNGGTHAIVRGSGFTSAVRVFFGDTEVPAEDVLDVDPGRVQVTVPAGHPGRVDVSAQNGEDGSTRATLAQAYVYDAFYVTPASGPVSGGTVITLHGDGAGWTSATKVFVDSNECAVSAVRDLAGTAQELDCTTPAGTPGAQAVRTVSEAGSSDVPDAFLYSDSEDGFRGGLSGAPLDGKLRVIALAGGTNRAVPGATVILGGDPGEADVKTADDHGVVEFARPSLDGPVTVTIAARCLMPTTFVDVPVDTVTAYLDPVLSTECASGSGGQIPTTPRGSTQASARVEGELVWPSTLELRIGAWDVPEVNGPDGSDDVRRAAYVLPFDGSATGTFRLPSKSLGVTPEDLGHIGYSFALNTSVGNLTFYALAGIEDRTVSPPLFTAYTLGLLTGVGTAAGKTTKDVYIQMNIPLDHAMVLGVDGPTPTPRGPDRVEGHVAIRVGTYGYLTLPIGSQTSLLPSTAPLSFVGLPPLVHGLAGAEYVTNLAAFTGDSRSPPRSVLSQISTSSPAGVRHVDGFMEVPRLDVPGRDGAWNGRDLAVSASPGGPDADLTILNIASGGGLSTWTVVLPRGVDTARLPDLAAAASLDGPAGAVSITVNRAALRDFDYGALRYSNLSTGTWTAYATDVFQAHR